MTDATRERKGARKGTQEKPKRTRKVPSSTTCMHCRGSFWAPKGEIVCPHCGKRTVVERRIVGNLIGFFRSLLEGIAVSGAFSRVEVSHPCPRPIRCSHGLSDAYQKVMPETPHQKRAAEGRNHEKRLQDEAGSEYTCGREEIE
jgi:DNA-directed RNA polymerase subunit RPC12/RpoP